jgi:plasmid stabilization system protein ParE
MAAVRTTPRADRRIAEAAKWWWDNRSAAPDLFIREFIDATLTLSRTPEIGTPQRHRTISGLRRLLLERTRYHVYYVYRIERDEVWILSVWSALRGRRPPLTFP